MVTMVEYICGRRSSVHEIAAIQTEVINQKDE